MEPTAPYQAFCVNAEYPPGNSPFHEKNVSTKTTNIAAAGMKRTIFGSIGIETILAKPDISRSGTGMSGKRGEGASNFGSGVYVSGTGGGTGNEVFSTGGSTLGVGV